MPTVTTRKRPVKKNAASSTVAIHAKMSDGAHNLVGIGNLRVFIIPDGKFWFAQGLEIDYAAQGNSIDEAKKYFESGLEETIDLHLRMHGDLSRFLRVAPTGVLLEAAQKKSAIQTYWQVSEHRSEEHTSELQSLRHL